MCRIAVVIAIHSYGRFSEVRFLLHDEEPGLSCHNQRSRSFLLHMGHGANKRRWEESFVIRRAKQTHAAEQEKGVVGKGGGRVQLIGGGKVREKAHKQKGGALGA